MTPELNETRKLERLICMSCAVALLSGALGFVAAAPALADHKGPTKRDDLIARCIRDYGDEHSDRCVEIVSPQSIGRRAIIDYQYRRRGQVDCEDPRVTNPLSCAIGGSPRYLGADR